MGHISTVFVRNHLERTQKRRHKVIRFRHFPTGLKWWHSLLAGGKSRRLNVKVTKETFENTVPCATHVWQSVRQRKGRPFVKVSLQSAALGEKYNETMKGLHQEQGGRLFLSTFASHLLLQTKHEMTVISNAPYSIPAARR